MKIALRIILLAIILGLGYITWEAIAAPVRLKEQVEIKEAAVIEKLKLIQKAQLLYKDENGKFAKDFDLLKEFVLEGDMTTIIENGSKDDTTTVYSIEKVRRKVKATEFADVDVSVINTMNLVPFYDTLQFEMKTNTLDKNGVVMPVFQVTDPKPFDQQRVIDRKPLRVGSVFEVDYTGNWVGKK